MTKELTAMIADVRASLEEKRNSIFYWMTRTNQDAASARALLGTLKERLTANITTLDKLAAAVEGMGEADETPTPNWLLSSAQALLDLDAGGSLLPHGIGNHARDIIQQFISVHRNTERMFNEAKTMLESVTQPTPPTEMGDFDYQRVRQWALSEFRERANLAFTAGTNRNVAYLIEELFARPAEMDEERFIIMMITGIAKANGRLHQLDDLDHYANYKRDALGALEALKQIATITPKGKV